MQISKKQVKDVRGMMLSITPYIEDIMTEVESFTTRQMELNSLVSENQLRVMQATKLRAALQKSEQSPDELNKAVDEIITLEARISDIQKQAEKQGLGVLKGIFDTVLHKQYDNVTKILAAVFETDLNAVESKTLEEVVEMLVSILQDPVLMRFFPQLRPLAKRLQSESLQT